jgi:hypothetical protein
MNLRQEAFEGQIEAAFFFIYRKIEVKTVIELDAWHWAQEVAEPFAANEAAEEYSKSGEPLTLCIAKDMRFRLGEQLPSIVADMHRGEGYYKEMKAQARAGKRLAKRLEAFINAF